MNRNHIILGLFLVLLAASTASFAMWGGKNQAPYDPSVTGTGTSTVATTTDQTPEEPTDAAPAPSASDHGYGTVTLKLNEVASFPDGLSIRPTAVLEDSRCPLGVMCIQAGTVRVSVRIRSAMGISVNEFKPDTTVTTEGESITLVEVAPVKRRDQTIGQDDYRFTFKVEKRDVGTVPATNRCYVGGCSAQICSDQPDIASNCEYRAEYGCYKTAKCERQATGQCGWTDSPELRSCLANPPKDSVL